MYLQHFRRVDGKLIEFKILYILYNFFSVLNFVWILWRDERVDLSWSNAYLHNAVAHTLVCWFLVRQLFGDVFEMKRYIKGKIHHNYYEYGLDTSLKRIHFRTVCVHLNLSFFLYQNSSLDLNCWNIDKMTRTKIYKTYSPKANKNIEIIVVVFIIIHEQCTIASKPTY